LITHDIYHAMQADRILYMEAGRIAEQGTHEELLRAGGRYAALHQLQGESRTERHVHASAG
jgi:ATP-binding cassette subfamily B protein